MNIFGSSWEQICLFDLEKTPNFASRIIKNRGEIYGKREIDFYSILHVAAAFLQREQARAAVAGQRKRQ